MRYTVILVAVLLIAGCESKEAKYTRLNQRLQVASLIVDGENQAAANNQPVCPDLSKLSTNAYLTACAKRVQADQMKLALAQREMNAFMNK